jgi:predicted RNA-binding protein (virulence factor B family)
MSVFRNILWQRKQYANGDVYPSIIYSVFVFSTSEASEFITEQCDLFTVDIYDVSHVVSVNERTRI